MVFCEELCYNANVVSKKHFHGYVENIESYYHKNDDTIGGN